MSEEPLSRLIARLREPDTREESFIALFRRFHDRIYRSFPASVPAAVRSELTQEVFIKIHRHVETLPVEYFEAWLHRLARRTLLSWYERENRRKRKGVEVSLDIVEEQGHLEMAVARAALEPTPLDDALNAEKQRVLLAAIDELPRQMRSCLLLRILDDRTIDEIARLLRLAPGTVKAHLHAARSRLKPRLAVYFTEVELEKGEPS